MSIISKENIIKVMASYNPWWKTGVIAPEFARKYHRTAYYEAMQYLDQKDLRRTIILSGVRRVGKTTIQYQMIKTLLKRDIAPHRILFIALDHPVLKLAGLAEILECYHETVYAGEDSFYFFDEIQYAADWANWLKTIYDRQPNTYMVATGSASPALVKNSTESGVGRWSVIHVPTLSFYEYCSLLGLSNFELPPNIKPTEFALLKPEKQTDIMLRLSGLQNHFNRYLQLGGFPELALAQNDLRAQQIIREDVVDKVLKRDLPAIYKIRNATELERIFLYLCTVSSSIVATETIAKELNGVSWPTVENYIQYLASANLIYLSQPVSLSGKKVLKAKPKIYIADAAIRNAVLMDDSVLTNPEEMGRIVETAVYKHIAAFYYKAAAKIGYYRNSQKAREAEKEIDIVVEYPRIKSILIEVKYREQADISDNSAICEFAAQANAALVITKKPTDYGVHHAPGGKLLTRIPAFAFLYLLGYVEQTNLIGQDGA